MVCQALINGIAAGSTYALVALGFGLIFQVQRFFHFSHGAVYSAAAYFTYVFLEVLGWNSFVGIVLALCASALLGTVLYLSTYRPLSRRGASPLALLIASLGILIVIQNLLSLIFGDRTLRLRTEHAAEGWLLWGAYLTGIQAVTIASAVVVSTVISCWVRYSKWGRLIRAVANDPELAVIAGVNTGAVVAVTFAVGSAVAGLAAVLSAYDTDMTPLMGFRAILMGVVAMVVGGVDSVAGAFVGGLFIGLAQHIGVLRLPTQWQDAIVFVILIICLLFRPQGAFGRRLGRAAI